MIAIGEMSPRSLPRRPHFLALLGAVLVSAQEGGTPLHDAAANGHTAKVKELVAAGASLEARDDKRLTPLHWAARNGHAAAATALAEAGASLEARGDETQTPLHWAAAMGHSDAVRALVAAGAPLELPGDGVGTPLHWAAVKGHAEAVEILAAAGASLAAQGDSDQTPLHWAVAMGHTEAVKALVAAGAPLDALDAGTRTPLHMARDEATAKILTDAAQDSDAGLRSFGASSGVGALLSGLGLGDDALPAAAAWFDKEGAKTLDEVLELDLIDEFVAALGLKRVPALKLTQALKQKKGGKEEL